MIERIAEIKRIPFDDVFDIEIVEFLNLIQYITYKNKELERTYGKGKSKKG